MLTENKAIYGCRMLHKINFFYEVKNMQKNFMDKKSAENF